MAMVAPKHQTANCLLLDRVQFWHQLRKQLLARFIEERPPCFLARFLMDDADAVWSRLRTIMSNFKCTKQMLFALQPFPRGQSRWAIEA